MRKLFLMLSFVGFASCDNTASVQDAETKTATIDNIYSQEQISFEDKYAELDDAIKKAEGNSYLYQEAIDNRSKLQETTALHVTDWGGVVTEVGSAPGANCMIDLQCYRNTHYQLQFDNVPIDKIKQLKVGTKIRFSGTRQAHWSYITDGTFSIIE